MHTLDSIDAASMRADIPAFRPGDTLKVHVRVIEGNRSRIQVFQGAVIRRQGSEACETFTVRRSVSACRTHLSGAHPGDRPDRGRHPRDVRRAKLYYLRDLRGKKAKIKEKRETLPR